MYIFDPRRTFVKLSAMVAIVFSLLVTPHPGPVTLLAVSNGAAGHFHPERTDISREL